MTREIQKKTVIIILITLIVFILSLMIFLAFVKTVIIILITLIVFILSLMIFLALFFLINEGFQYLLKPINSLVYKRKTLHFYDHEIGELIIQENDLRQEIGKLSHEISFSQGNRSIPHRFSKNLNELKSVRASIAIKLEEQKERLNQSKSILLLLEHFEDATEIEISDLARIIRLSEDETEKHIKYLLKEDDHLGSYDQKTHTFRKGIDLHTYIEFVSNRIKEIEQLQHTVD